MIADPQSPSRLLTALTVAFAMIFPTATAWVYFLALGGTGKPNLSQQAVYAAGKTIQFAIPLLFLVFLERRRPRWRTGNAGWLLLGVAFGLLVGGVLLAGYFGWLRSSRLLGAVPERLRVKLGEFGVSSGLEYLALSVFLCVAHSFLEEYYWRWFVFGRLRTLTPVGLAVALSSLAFLAHHVLVVWAYVPDRLLTGVVPASLAVGAGGAVWAWLYHRSGSLLPPWISHVLIDAALFVIGWDLLQRS